MFWIRINSIAGFLLAPLQILAITRLITVDDQALYYLVTPVLSMGYLIEFNSPLILAGDSAISGTKISREASSIYNYLMLTVPILLSINILYFLLFNILNLYTLFLAFLASLDVAVRVIMIKVEKQNKNKSFQLRTVIQLVYSVSFILSLLLTRNVLISLISAIASKRCVELSYSHVHFGDLLNWRRGTSPFLFIRKQKIVIFANILGHIYSYLMVPVIASFSSNLFVAQFGATQSVFYALNSFVKSRGRNYWTKDALLPKVIGKILKATALEHVILSMIAIIFITWMPLDFRVRFLSGEDIIFYALSMLVIVVLSTLVDLRRLKRPSYAGKASLIFVCSLLFSSYVYTFLPGSMSFIVVFFGSHVIYASILFYEEVFDNRLRV